MSNITIVAIAGAFLLGLLGLALLPEQIARFAAHRDAKRRNRHNIH